jgi:GTP-binding protein LepA
MIGALLRQNLSTTWRTVRCSYFYVNPSLISTTGGGASTVVLQACYRRALSSSGSPETPGASVPIPTRAVSLLENHELINKIPLEDVRNFCFIAHVDHGKSSLSSRILEITGNLGKSAQQTAFRAAKGEPSEESTSRSTSASREGQKEQIELLDTLNVEQERGITVKATTASMLYPHPSAVGPEGIILLNMIDTPGHIDFGREVVRSLSFVQGAILLLDATQGIQAQTWTVHEKAKTMQNAPTILLAMTKIDLDAARPIQVALTVSEWLSIDDPDSIIPTSARNRIGIAELLDKICHQVPPPRSLSDDDGLILRAQVVDSWYDGRGVNCIVQIVSGTLSEGDKISIAAEPGSQAQQQSYPVQEVGLVLPKTKRVGSLGRGQMGYVRFGLREPRQAQPGTLLISSKHVGKDMIRPARPSDNVTKSVLYASVHPTEEDGFEELCNGVDRLALNDTGLEVAMTSSVGASNGDKGGPFLGPGLRVGFQGLLHVEVFQQRLLEEFGLDCVVTPPKVPYHITFQPSKSNNLKEAYTKIVEDLGEWPEFGTKYRVEEPIVGVRIMSPVDYTGSVMDLITRKRGTDLKTRPLDEDTWVFEARIPWAEVVVNFHDTLKNITAGYGSMDTYDVDPPLVEADLYKVDIVLNGEEVGPLAFVCHKQTAQTEARVVCKKLQEVLPRQNFAVIIQAKAGGKILASERIRPFRKDVLVKSGKVVGGGDSSRKKKLLEAQKRGKKRLQQSGSVTLSQSAFNSVISRSS